MATWRSILPVHPAADLLPLLSREELEKLAENIARNGLLALPTVWHDLDTGRDYLLDGRNRLDAMELAGIDFLSAAPDGRLSWNLPRGDHHRPAQRPDVVDSCSETKAPNDPVAIVIAANLARRHLPLAERTRIAAELLKLQPDRSDRQVAATVGLSHGTVARVRRDGEAAGDVDILATSTDTRGRVQPRRRIRTNPTPRPEPPLVATASRVAEERWEKIRAAFLDACLARCRRSDADMVETVHMLMTAALATQPAGVTEGWSRKEKHEWAEGITKGWARTDAILDNLGEVQA